MNAMTGWALAAAALLAGWFGYGWPGVIMAISVIVFWLLLQLSRALRVMRKAAERPLGRIGSAVMLQSRLVRGMTMMKVVGMTGSLGCKIDGAGDVWRWEDEGGLMLTLHFSAGTLSHWLLDRPAETTPETKAGTALGALPSTGPVAVPETVSPPPVAP